MNMTVQIEYNLSSKLKKISELFSILIVIVGFLVLIGWAFDISILKSPGPGFSTIKSNVGLCFIFIGASLWLMLTKRTDPRARLIAQILAVLAALIGLVTLLEDILHLNMGIDEMLFHEAPGALLTFAPNRMAVTASTSIFLLGTALLLMDQNTKWGYRLSQLLIFITGFITLLAIVGYIYGVSTLYYLPDHTSIAIYAAVTLLLAVFSLSFAQPDKGPMGVITSSYMGGYISLRLIPLAAILPIVLGWIMLLGYNNGFYGFTYGTSLLVVANAIILMIIIWWIARSLNQIDYDRDNVEKTLRASQLYNRSLIEANLDPLVTIGPDGKITDANKATEEITGYTRNQLIDTDFSNYFTQPDKAKKGYKRVFKEGLVRDYPLEIQHQNGATTPVLYNATVYKNETGDVIGVFAAARDITQLKKAEEELKLASLYNRSLIEASLDPLVTIGPNGKITDVNNATEIITGCLRDELIGTDFSNYFTEPDKARAGYQKVFKEGFVRDYPLEIQHADGHATSVLYNASVYKDESGGVVGVFAAARDITQLKKAEEELKKHRDTLEKTVQERTKELANTNEALEEEIEEHQKAEEKLEEVVEELTRSNKDLEQFAYIASHDLQEPLRSVSGFLQLLSRRYHGKLDPKADQYIDIAVGGAGRMQTMIEDLLKFSRVTTRGEKFKPTDFETVLSDVSMDLKAMIDENNAVITHDPLPTVMADESQMKQLFQNLVANAIKFHGEAPPEVQISAQEKNSKWIFSVADNGIGIDPNYGERIFEVFKRLHTRRKYSGTGIGLAVSRKIVERHGGRIWVDSKPSEGSIFYFTIPKGG